MFNDHSLGCLKDHTSLLLHVDGGCGPENPGGTVTAGWVLYDPKKPNIPLVEEGKVVRDGGSQATNNFGEFSALGLALTYLKGQNWKGEITIKADSKLLVEQVNGRWKCKAPHLIILRDKILDLLKDLSFQLINESEPLVDEGKHACRLVHVKREFNVRPDELCHLAFEEYHKPK